MLKLFRRLVSNERFLAVQQGVKGSFSHRRRFISVETPPVATATASTGIPSAVVGQPTCHTHPHLIPPGHLTCEVTQAEYADRRASLVARLEEENPNTNPCHIIVIPAACKQYMSENIPYVFRQNSNFYYLTGCLEPGAVLILIKPKLSDKFKSILFLHDKDSHAELWEGPRTGCTQATQLFAVDEARPIDTVQQFLQKTISQSNPSTLWYCKASAANPKLDTAVRSLVKSEPITVSLMDPQKTLHAMRIIKSPAEVKLMQETCYIGAQSMNIAMACTKPGISEHTVNAVLDYTCRTAGAEHLAFPPVVAGGSRATHIHYVANNQILAQDQLLLVDSGCQRWLYNSDISRTWPVSGKFSPHHRILYELVLAVQKRLIVLLGERPPLDELFNSMCLLLGKHLQEEGILSKTLSGQELVTKAYRLCPHHVSHYLGLDVHDTPLIKRHAPVRTGMVVTVEPGIYLLENDTSVPKEFRGVGIRVEDDVLITDGAPLVLTAAAAKEVDDIEALVGKQAA